MTLQRNKNVETELKPFDFFPNLAIKKHPER
jgi:hypothetical protein